MRHMMIFAFGADMTHGALRQCAICAGGYIGGRARTDPKTPSLLPWVASTNRAGCSRESRPSNHTGASSSAATAATTCPPLPFTVHTATPYRCPAAVGKAGRRPIRGRRFIRLPGIYVLPGMMRIP